MRLFVEKSKTTLIEIMRWVGSRVYRDSDKYCAVSEGQVKFKHNRCFFEINVCIKVVESGEKQNIFI